MVDTMTKEDDKKGKKGVAIIIAVGGKPPNPPTKTLDPDEKKKMDDAWAFLKEEWTPTLEEELALWQEWEDENNVPPLKPEENEFIASANPQKLQRGSFTRGNQEADAEERAQVEMQQGKLTDSGEDPLPVVGQSGYDMRATEDRPIEETLDPAIQHGLAQREISGPLMSARPKQRELDFSDPPNPFQKAWAFLKNEPTHCPIHGDKLQMIGDPGADEFGPSWCPTCAEVQR